MKRETLEEQTAGAILQMPRTVRIGADAYPVPAPTIATLMLASEAVARLPAVRLDSKNAILECLYVAKDCRALGDVIATIVLGAKNLRERRRVSERRCFGLLRRTRWVEVDKRRELSQKILEEMSPEQMSELLAGLLAGLQPAFFFRHYHFPDRGEPAAGDANRNDSVWAAVAGIVKAFNLPVDYVLYEMSYLNMILYSSVLPSYRTSAAGAASPQRHERIDADDPANRDQVRSIIHGR